MLLNHLKIMPENDVLVFVHIPKTAGSSLISAIEQGVGNSHCLYTRMSKIDRLYPSPLLYLHAALRQNISQLACRLRGTHYLMAKSERQRDLGEIRFVAGHFPLGGEPETGKRHIHVSLVRNPVDLFVSKYYFDRENLSNWPPKKYLGNPSKIAISKLSINEYAEWLSQANNRRIHNIQCQYIGGTQRFQDAKRAVDEKVFLCAPISEISMFYRILAEKFRFPAIEIGNENRSKTRPKEFQLDKQAIEYVHAMYAQDFKLFDYVKSCFSEESAIYFNNPA